MGKASDYELKLYNRFTCLTPQELISLTQRDHLSIVGRLALKVSEEQVLAATELHSPNEAAAYSYARSIIRLYVPEREGESVMGDTWTSSEF